MFVLYLLCSRISYIVSMLRLFIVFLRFLFDCADSVIGSCSSLEGQNRVVWTGLIWPRIGTSVGLCELGNVALGSVKCWEILG
jgi:hypothetical protein